jgi:hypothetical protein
MVESANKLVVEARLKGAGMRWERKNVNKMLTLRNAVCSDRWQATWQEAGVAVLLQQKLHRELRRKQREEAKLLTCDPRLLESPPLPPKAEPTPRRFPPAPPTPPATLLGSSRPSAHHPWKRPFKSGRACSPKEVAKI